MMFNSISNPLFKHSNDSLYCLSANKLSPCCNKLTAVSRSEFDFAIFPYLNPAREFIIYVITEYLTTQRNIQTLNLT